jgi:hypothetical protein
VAITDVELVVEVVLGRVEPGAEAAVPDHLGAVRVAQPPRSTEVVGVGVGDDDGVHVAG